MNRAKRFLSMLLTLCMLLGLFPSTAYAANSTHPFTDVNEADWFSDAVQYVYQNGLMNGTGNTIFSPNDSITRGQIVTILHRLEGTPSSAGASFADVPNGEYYANAVAWSSANGIMGGYGGGLFGPTDPITREQLATTMYRYAQHKGYNTTITGNIAAFSDGGTVSSYAVDAVNWAIGVGLLTGMGNNMFAPTSGSTRAQAATILMRFCENIVSSGEDTTPNEDTTPTTPSVEYHTVTFNYNYDNKGTYDTAIVEHGKRAASPTNPTRSGYTFNGWYTAASGGSKFNFSTAITSDLTLYAHWTSSSSGSGGNGSGGSYVPDPTPTPTPGTYTVTFNSNGGSAVPSQTVISGTQATKPVDPIKSGYTFGGWFTDQSWTTEYYFTEPVTMNIELFAKWNEVADQPDDGRDEEDTEVTEDDKFILSASEHEVLANSQTNVLFYVNSTLTVPYFELYFEGQNTGVQLFDNGNTSNGDDIPNDGCYTGIYSIDSSVKDDDIVFYAQAVVGDTPVTTNDVSIFVYYELTDAEIQDMEDVNEEIQKIMTEVRSANSTAAEEDLIKALHDALLAYLESEAKVDNIDDDQNNYIISFRYVSSDTSGGVKYFNKDVISPGSVYTEGEFSKGVSSRDGSYETGVSTYNTDFNINYITYREKALLLCYDAAHPGWDGGSLEDISSNLQEMLENAGFSAEVRYSVTVDDFKEMQDYDYINIACHGNYYKESMGWFQSETTPVICTSQGVTSSNKKTYSADLKKHRIAAVSTVDENGNPDGTHYWIRPAFFEYYYAEKPLKANVVSLGCCKGAYTDDLVNSFITAGASAVLAYSDTVYTAYDYQMSAEILNQMFAGHTVSEALSTAKNIYGADDLVWGHNLWENGNQNFETLKPERAEGRLYGDGSTKIHHMLNNGNFDSTLDILFGSLTSWKQYGDARSIFRLAGLTPQSFPKMAIVSSGFGSMNDETTSCIYQTFLVPENVTTIEFSYDVVSEEPMEFVGTEFDDIFQADILDTNGNILETLAYESVNTSEWFAIDGIDFPGGDDTTYHTRWQTVSSDAIAKYRGQLVVLRFTVQDAGDSIYDTAAIIDSISIK